MAEKLTVKYFANNGFAKEPVQASKDAAKYDLYAEEVKALFPHLCSGLTIELRIVICNSGVVEADYRGIVAVLLITHSSEYSTIQVLDRIGQMVFMKKIDVNFEKVAEPDLLGKTNLLFSLTLQ